MLLGGKGLIDCHRVLEVCALFSFDSLFIFIIKMLYFFLAKVAVQIVDYYNLAANTLDLISSDECSVSEILGAKIYKVRARVNTGEM
jgi:hypothetical protein